MASFCKLMKRQRGAAAIEFAMLITLLLMVVAGIVEFGRTFWYYDALNKATRDGARFLSISRAESNPPAIDGTLKDEAKTMVALAATAAKVPGFSKDDDVNVDCNPSCDAPAYVTVSINAYKVKIGDWIPFVSLASGPWEVTLSPSTTMPYMCSSSGTC